MITYDAKCLDQVGRTMKVLRGKWTVQILCALLYGPVRLSQLRRLIPAASKKTLTANLRPLEKLHLIVRQDLSNSVLHVEYEIAEPAREPWGRWSTSFRDFRNTSPWARTTNDAIQHVFDGAAASTGKVLYYSIGPDKPASGQAPGGRSPAICRSTTSYLRLVTVSDPPSKQLNAILGPGALSS
jgi:DNA-binding HxlR family transcriptional regulator